MNKLIFPNIVFWELPIPYRKIISLVYKQKGYVEVEKFHLFYLNEKHNKYIFSDFPSQKIHILNEYNNFYYIFTEEKNNNLHFKQKLLDIPITNVIFLNEPFNWILPETSISIHNKLLLIYSNSKYKYIYKNIGLMSGYYTFNFDNVESLIYFIKEYYNDYIEILIIIDLDFLKDPEKTFYEFNEQYRENPQLKLQTKIICIKDINKNTHYSLLNFLLYKKKLFYLPDIKKIFHPEELILILIEGLIFYDPNIKEKIYYYNINSLNEYLYEDLEPEHFLKKELNISESIQNQLQYYKKILPVLWLYDFFKNHIKQTKTLFLS